MAKRGRPRKHGPRHPGGQLKYDEAGRITVTAWQRLRELGRDPVLATQLGRLGFLGELTAVQVQTGLRIAEIYGCYDRAMGRRRSVASPAYEVGRAGRSTDIETDVERKRAAMRAFGDLEAEIRLCPGFVPWFRPRGIKLALEELCVEDRPCPPGWLPQVKIALDMLAVPLGLRGRRRS